MQKPRILCLHGYHGSADLLRRQMRSLVTGLGSAADFVYVDAPSLATGDFGWWHAVRMSVPGAKGPGVGSTRMHYDGWERTRDWVVSVFDRQGPFDGVFGFSQGATLASLLVGMRAPGRNAASQSPLSFDFAIMVGGFVSNDPSHGRLYEARDAFDLPSVHIIGRSDFVVRSTDSHDLASRFVNPLVLEHDGGHVVAGTPEICASVAAFLAIGSRAHSSGSPESRRRTPLE
jgi:hypothetical protein